MDKDAKQGLLQRLRRIEGQVRGLQKMVEDERYCAEVLTQIASVENALGAVSKVLLRNHLEHCVTGAIRTGKPGEAEKKYDELLKLFDRHYR